jgi:hypothetical protein
MQQKNIITNFTEYFKQERDVYVQNVSTMQVSMQFPVGNGQVESLLLPANVDPLNLTQMLPYEVIKRSMDLRKLVNRRPAVLVLLSEEEYMSYYQEKAEEEGIDLQEAISRAQSYQNDLQNKKVFTTPLAPERKTIEAETLERTAQPLDPEDVITPRIVGLCNDETIQAREMLAQIKAVAKTEGLTRADLEYLLSHGKHKSVQVYTQNEIQTREAAK